MTANPSTRDHPRVCGEHCTVLTNESWKPGSSPRMRGTLQRSPQRHVPAGIIPAYAGNTADDHEYFRQRWDHPRVCGEHQRAFEMTCNQEGSSPRMRGTLYPCALTLFSCGIIPAYAGNTRTVLFRSRKTWDHPRVCGEHDCSPEDLPLDSGPGPALLVGRGIIPAYAGNTLRD